jgi:hypothetical protein
VVQPPSGAKGVLDLAVHYDLGSFESRPDNAGVGFMHALEDRVVLRAEPVSLEIFEDTLATTGFFHPPHVAPGVYECQVLICCRLGFDHLVLLQKPQRLAQLYEHADPYRFERVIAAEPVFL